MNEQTALIEILERMGARRDGVLYINEAEIREWPSQTFEILKSQKLISRAVAASTATCPGCEQQCTMPVRVLKDEQGDQTAFIVCDKSSGQNRVNISLNQLNQWQSNLNLVVKFIAECLGIRLIRKKIAEKNLIEIGIAKGKKRDQLLCLAHSKEIVLQAGNNTLPITEIIVFKNSKYLLDVSRIERLVDCSTTDVRYTPSISKRELKKQETQYRRERWRHEYLKLKQHNYKMSDRKCAAEIAKSKIGEGYDAGTIKRYMK